MTTKPETKPAAESPEEEKLFTSLRAQVWTEFHGQERVKQSLHVALTAAKKRKESLEHTLLYGPVQGASIRDSARDKYRFYGKYGF